MAERRIFVTGGSGYIGSHTVVELVNAGYYVTIVDNFSNSSMEAVERVRKLVSHPERIELLEVDLLDSPALAAAISKHKYEAVIHFAALKAVGESVSRPIAYYRNNITGLLNLLDAMDAASVPSIVFSSSATVYGSAQPPFTEATATGEGITNPYGRTKAMAESILRDWQVARPHAGVVLLRYFNPVGAHSSGTIGEDPAGLPNNLVPYIQRVACKRLPHLTVHGSDYNTPDGTAQRDYIHVVDLARGHLKALDWLSSARAASLSSGQAGGVAEVFNLGTGRAVTVLEMVAAYEKASGVKIPLVMGPRRAGDVAGAWADPAKAQRVLGWAAEKSVEDMCADSWKWVCANPYGYGKAPEGQAAAAAGGAGGSA